MLFPKRFSPSPLRLVGHAASSGVCDAYYLQLQNIADMNSKSHSKNRFLALMCAFGLLLQKVRSWRRRADEITVKRNIEKPC